MDSKERFDKEVQAVRMESWLHLLDDAVRDWLAWFSTDEKNRHRGDYEALVDIGGKIIRAFHNGLCIYKPYDDQTAREFAIWSELGECWWGAKLVMELAIEDWKREKELSVTPDDIEEWGRWTDCRATPKNDKSVQLWFRFAAAENAVQRFGDWGSERPDNPKWLVCAPRKKDKEPAAVDGSVTDRNNEAWKASGAAGEKSTRPEIMAIEEVFIKADESLRNKMILYMPKNCKRGRPRSGEIRKPDFLESCLQSTDGKTIKVTQRGSALSKLYDEWAYIWHSDLINPEK